MSEGTKFDEGKPQWHLLMRDLAGPLRDLAMILTHGAEKYAECDWMHVQPRSRYISAMYRHLNAWHSGERLDPDSGLPHLAHVACNVIFLSWFERQGEVLNERPVHDPTPQYDAHVAAYRRRREHYEDYVAAMETWRGQRI